MPRRPPSLKFQLAILGLALIVLITAAFVTDGDSGRSGSGPGVATTTTRRVGFPAALDESLCRSLITTREAEALVGRPLAHPVIEPQDGQCAWPSEQGNPLDAELFFEILPRSASDLATELGSIFKDLPHRLDPVDGLGTEAYFVVRLTAPELAIEADFVEGLYVYSADFVVILANGGRHIWEGTDDEVKARLRSAMEMVLDRVQVLLQSPP